MQTKYNLDHMQELFNRVWEHFVMKKNPPGIREQEDTGLPVQCVYDTPSGGCAVGILLPPEVRHKMANFYGDVSHALRTYQEVQHVFAVALLPFLSEMQIAHDTSANRNNPHFHDDFQEKLIAIARKHKLTIPGFTT